MITQRQQIVYTVIMRETNQVIRTLRDVMEKVMAPSAGGSMPDFSTNPEDEYMQWVSWIQQKQEEYAVRAFWRRLLTREEIEIEGDTTVLPDRFHKPNGLYVLDVDGVDYADPDNPQLTVEMITDPTDTDFGKWQIRFKDTQERKTAIIWYFANPPVPTDETDIVLLPGDMIGYSALGEYFRSIGADGSQDKAEEDAENRFIEYLSMEMIPPRHELLTIKTQQNVDRIAYQKQFYYRSGRYFRNY